MNKKATPIRGQVLGDAKPYHATNPLIKLSGTFNGTRDYFSLSEDILSKHMLLIGGTGCGKTNVFFHIIDQLKQQMTPNDVMIIFDTKEDFFRQFFDKSKDCVIANSKRYENVASIWNVYKEVIADGWEDGELETNINEISYAIFQEAIENNKSQPFFPNAARDLFAAILTYIVRIGKDDLAFKQDFFNNKALKKYFDMMSAQSVKNMLETEADLASVLSYIGDGNSDQALGVFAELQSVVRKLFTGTFAKDGKFSVRNFVREKQGRTLFVEYDLSQGSVLTPIYQLIIDLALKEALGREHSEGNVYLIFDEFKLLPHLRHIDDAVNFGRSLGVKVCAGLQSIEQLNENYGEARGRNIAAGFSSVFSFKANDIATREFTTGLYGTNIVLEEYKSFDNPVRQEKREGHTVEDWDLQGLDVGEAIIGLPFIPPFKFRCDLYKKGG